MGRRKSKRKVPIRRRNVLTLETQFTCPFCNHEKACEANLDKSKNVGRISCRICKEFFKTPITFLSEPVDVYNDWIDACERLN